MSREAKIMDKPEHAWMVRAGNDNELAEIVGERGEVAIGWPELGDISHLDSREKVKRHYRKKRPGEKPGRVPVNAGQLYRFSQEVHKGDYVLTYLKSSRQVLIGIVTGDYEYREEALLDHYPHVRSVNWIKEVSRDDFGTQAKNSLGSILTVFNLDPYLDQIHALANEEYVEVPKEEEEVIPFYDEVKSQADELISDLISKIDPYDFQDLVSGLLEAVGYQSYSTSPGRDRGIDIIAHPDSLGFRKPRIVAQVKHRSSKVSGPEMRAFLATLREDDNGLYVSTGGYTGDAQSESERSRRKITLLDRDQFIGLLLEYYQKLAPEYQAMIPLRQIWVPKE